MKLALRMFKMFCSTLDMTDNIDLPHINKLNNDKVRISVRKRTNTNKKNDMIVTAATSFWLPLSPHNLFDFLKDNNSTGVQVM